MNSAQEMCETQHVLRNYGWYRTYNRRGGYRHRDHPGHSIHFYWTGEWRHYVGTGAWPATGCTANDLARHLAIFHRKHGTTPGYSWEEFEAMVLERKRKNA